MTLNAAELEAALLSHGFVVRNSKHKVFTLVYGGRLTKVKTVISHGVTTIGAGLASQIKRQLFLKTSLELREFVDGTMDQRKYLALLKERRHIT